MAQLSFPLIDLHRKSNRQFIEWLGREGYLNLRRDCYNCGGTLQLAFTTSRATDNYQLKCPSCKHRESIRSDSIFALFHTPLVSLMRLAVLFANQTPATHASNMLDIDHKTVSAFYQLMRERMSIALDIDPISFSSNDVVEIDEMIIEALRGEEPEGGRTTGWIFGIVSRSTDEVHLEIIPNRRAETLVQVMMQHVAPNAIVCADSWASYTPLASRYTLRTIVKGRGGMRYLDRNLGIVVHTGTIEGVWSQLRAVLHVSRGFPAHYVPLLLAEFMFRKAGRDIFELMKILSAFNKSGRFTLGSG